uniref:Protein hunchback n=1 Tax=Cacopsylla melanoneura TaxID=428564 RepID=A0A8D8T434_9HEMI
MCENKRNLQFLDVPELVACQHCRLHIPNITDDIVEHSKDCHLANRPSTSYLYACILCSYHTYNRGHMRDHVMKEIGDKPYKCKLCNYSCTQRSNLRSHMLIRH